MFHSIKHAAKPKHLINENDFIILSTKSTVNDNVSIDKHQLFINKNGTYTFAGQYSINSDCPMGVSMQIINLQNNQVLFTSNGAKNDINFSGDLVAGDIIGFKTNYHATPKCVKLNLGISAVNSTNKNIEDGPYDNYDPAAVAQMLQNIDIDTNINIQWVISVPPTPAPCPNPGYEPQTAIGNDILLPPNDSLLWTANTIPWKAGLMSQNFDPVKQTGLFANLTPFSGHSYNKYQSIAYVLAFYAGRNFETLDPASPELTVFAKNFEDRGGDNMAKMKYMFALTMDKLHHYEVKTDALLDDVYNLIKDGTRPVISTFIEKMVRYFVDVHIGTDNGIDNIPQHVIDYFTNFVTVVGFVRNGNVDETEYNTMLLEGNKQAPQIYDHYRNRINKVIRNKETDTIAYHWNDGGLALESAVTESLHNIIAFVQFINTLHRTIVDKFRALNPGPQPSYVPASTIPTIALPIGPGGSLVPFTGPVNFFARYLEAGNDRKQHLDIVREIYRLLAPNGNGFSIIKETAPNGYEVQSRHVWPLIMIAQEEIPAALAGIPSAVLSDTVKKTISYFTYKPQVYQKDNKYKTSLEVEVKVPGNNKIDSHLTYSDVDNDSTYNDGTVIDKSNPKIIPVTGNKGNNLETPYYPFGMGYRACPGQIFSYFFADKMLAKFASLEWEFRDPGIPCHSTTVNISDYVALAPRNAVFDNLYVNANP